MIEITGLTVGYGASTVIHDLSLTVNEGEVTCVLGPNGAGKTTLLRALAGLLKPKSGQIMIGGKNVAKVAPVARRAQGLALVPEGRKLFPDLTVRENLLIGGYLRKDNRALQQDVADFLDRWPVIGRRREGAAGNLSGGEQQIVALGRALMGKPTLLLLDEPSLGLAPVLVNEIYQLISEITQGGLTTLLIEQNPLQALKVATTANVMVGGQIVASSPSEQITPDEIIAHFFTGSEGR